MDYHCNLCDKIIKCISKVKHFKSEYHISSENSIIRSCIILNPDFDKVDEVLRKYINIYNKKMINMEFVVC